MFQLVLESSQVAERGAWKSQGKAAGVQGGTGQSAQRILETCVNRHPSVRDPPEPRETPSRREVWGQAGEHTQDPALPTSQRVRPPTSEPKPPNEKLRFLWTIRPDPAGPSF